MKIILFSLCFIVAFAACNNKGKQGSSTEQSGAAEIAKDSAEDFFPVTTYLRGEIAQIKSIGITPIKKHIKNDVTIDSSWLKPEDYLKEFADFLTPEIDSTNLMPWYSQSKFLDQSVDAFTFTYEPVKALPDSMPLLHWDVYIDPKKQNVRRVFIRKKVSADEEKQLTWQSGKWCKIVTIKNTGTNVAIINEVKIEWSFD
jgi:hypothetical protein